MTPPAVGTVAQLEVLVTDAMTARFDDEDIHPVYGTAALVGHLEQCGRRLFRPALERGEEGVGAEVAVRHLAPVPVGRSVVHRARVAEATTRRLVTDHEVRDGERLVATGRFTQVVIDLADWRAALST